MLEGAPIGGNFREISHFFLQAGTQLWNKFSHHLLNTCTLANICDYLPSVISGNLPLPMQSLACSTINKYKTHACKDVFLHVPRSHLATSWLTSNRLLAVALN